MATHWFIPKSHGYGAAPANWKGWLAVATFVALQAVLAFSMVVWPAERGVLSEAGIAAWLLLMAGITVAFIWLCRRKTDGTWRWRWGTTSGSQRPPSS